METEGLRSLRDFIRWGASRFNQAGLVFGHGTDNAIDEAATLVLHALHLPSELHPDWLDGRLTPVERTAVTELLERRIRERKPAAYLTREARFAGLDFYVDERVLVPRSPIAELIEAGFAPWLAREPARILDLCTGSGCIAIACAYRFPEAEVDATDVSADALAVAAVNRERHHLEHRLRLIEADVYNGLDGAGYDLIVSNPPYVDAGEMAALPAEYRAEPAGGLAAGDDGLEVVRRILAGAAARLSPEGVIIVEVGNSAPVLATAYPEVPFLWLDFERGGDGVFLLNAEEVRTHQALFEQHETGGGV
jgi:ribosomal protein L3 glutamine methyltransferase